MFYKLKKNNICLNCDNLKSYIDIYKIIEYN